MSMSFIDFESSRKKDQQRQWEREARQAILEKAKSKYDAEQRKKEEARQRGEHTWMLPSVESKLHTDKKKKKKDKEKEKGKKKTKKMKKEKKVKKNKDSSSSSRSESEEDGGMWVERGTPKSTPAVGDASTTFCPPPPTPQETGTTEQQVKRDGWMEMTSLFKTYSREQLRELDGTSRKKEKEEEERKKREADKPGSHARELNPYFRDGGTGLPEKKGEMAELAGAGSGSGSGVDAAWLRRAMKRAQEQAQQEKRPLAEIAAQRWGSLEKFNELLAQAEGRERKKEDNWQSKERMNTWRSRSKERYRDDKRDSRRMESGDEKGDKIRMKNTYDKPCDGHSFRKPRSRSMESDDEKRDKVRMKNAYDKPCDRQSHRKPRSRSRERPLSQERRRRSNERKGQRRHSSSSSSSSRSRSKERKGQRRLSSSSSSSSSSSHSRCRSRRDDRKKDDNSERRPRLQGLKPPGDFQLDGKQPALSSRFLKPGHGSGDRYTVPSRESTKSGRGWQKQEYREPAKESHPRLQNKRKSSSSSSSSSSDSEDEERAGAVCRVNPDSKKNAGGSLSVNDDGGDSGAPSTKPPPGPRLSDKEMNDLGARIMKAELIGNEAQAEKLKVKLEAARAARASSGGVEGGEGKREVTEEVVVLTRMDSKGICRPVVAGEEGEERGGKKRKKGAGSRTHGKDGQRERYFPDDDSRDLKSMFEEEKGTTAEDQNEMFQRVANQAGERLDDEYDLDDMFMSKVATKETAARQAERDRLKAIQEHKRVDRSLESCQWCFDNKEMPKHLIVALGTKCYVSLPPHQSLTPGHCLIVPIHHVPCAVQADEDLWSEVQNFRKSLVRMFNSRDEDCVFFETVKRLRNFPHMAISCVPLPREVGDMAPIYFKKAILECEKEWAQNKKLVELHNRDVRRAVPKGLPYFFVDFGMQSGYAHVIEDEQDFPNNFAQEIVGGMLDLENNLWRKPRKENFDIQRRKVMEFNGWYKEFDPTQEQSSS